MTHDQVMKILLGLSPIILFGVLFLGAVFFNRESNKKTRLEELIATQDFQGFWRLRLSRRLTAACLGIWYTGVTAPAYIFELLEGPAGTAPKWALIALSGGCAVFCLYAIGQVVNQLQMGWTKAKNTKFGRQTENLFREACNPGNPEFNGKFGPNGAVRKS